MVLCNYSSFLMTFVTLLEANLAAILASFHVALDEPWAMQDQSNIAQLWQVWAILIFFQRACWILESFRCKTPRHLWWDKHTPGPIRQVRQTWNVDVRVNIDVAFHPLGTNTPQSTALFILRTIYLWKDSLFQESVSKKNNNSWEYVVSLYTKEDSQCLLLSVVCPAGWDCTSTSTHTSTFHVCRTCLFHVPKNVAKNVGINPFKQNISAVKSFISSQKYAHLCKTVWIRKYLTKTWIMSRYFSWETARELTHVAVWVPT